MKQSLDLKSIQTGLTNFFERFHTVLFFIIVGAGLMICLVRLVFILNESSQIDTSQVQQVNQSFDESTMKQLEQMDSQSNSSNFQLPSGRTNPFVE